MSKETLWKWIEQYFYRPGGFFDPDHYCQCRENQNTNRLNTIKAYLYNNVNV